MLAQAGSLVDLSYPHLDSEPVIIDGIDRFYKLFSDGEVPSAEDEVSQAEWLGALALQLESHAVLGPSYGGTQLVSGGVVRSWQDEWWMGGSIAQGSWFGAARVRYDNTFFRPSMRSEPAASLQGDCVGSPECFAMRQLCPVFKPGDQYTRSPCGASFPGLQPDGYVNEEW